jgi:tetratricopeptide (TPR) repeat protein
MTVLCLAFGASWWFVKGHQTTTNLDDVTPLIQEVNALRPEKPVPTGIKALIAHGHAPLPIPRRERVSGACENSWQQLRGLDLTKLTNDAASLSSIPLGRDCKSVPAALTTRKAAFEARCAPSTEGGPKLADCYEALVRYRMAITDWLTKDTPLTEINDPAVLAEKAMSRAFEAPAHALDVTAKLQKILPDAYPVAHLGYLAYFAHAESTASGDPENPKWKEAHERLAHLKTLAGANPEEIFELEADLAIVQTQSPDKVRTLARAYAEEHPRSGLPYYFMGWADFNDGDRESALAHFKEAAEREPLERRFAEAWTRAKTAKPGQGVKIIKPQVAVPRDLIEPGLSKAE